MRIPPLPRKNDSIEQTVREIIAYLRWSNITSVVGGELRRTPNGGTLTIEPGKPGGPGTPAGCTDLLPSLSLVESVWKLKVSPGFSDSVMPTIGGTALNATPAPALTVSTATTLWLVIVWEPAAENEEEVFWIAPGGTLVSASFQIGTTRPTETAAEVAEDGTKTNGTYAIAWADIVTAGESFTITANRCGNHQVAFCPPSSLQLSFD